MTLAPAFYTMQYMEILHLGQDLLRQKSLPVEEVNDELRSTIQAMFDTMEESGGVGLAAPQVGILRRFFVVVADDEVRRVFINPQIVFFFHVGDKPGIVIFGIAAVLDGHAQNQLIILDVKPCIIFGQFRLQVGMEKAVV